MPAHHSPSQANPGDRGYAPTPEVPLLELVRKLSALAGPIVLTQLGLMGFGLVDMLMLGRVGIAELDAAALGNLWSYGTVVFGVGVLFGLDPIIGKALGRGEHEQAGLSLQRGCILALLLSLPLTALAFVTQEVLLVLGQEPELAAMAEEYVLCQCWSIAPLLLFYAMRQYLQAREFVTPALWVTLLANLANILANRVLIFDLELGLLGAGLASGITRSLLGVGLFVWLLRGQLHRGAWSPWSRAAFEWAGLWEILRVGLPIGVQFLLEVWAFQVSTLLAGELGRHALAAHSIALNVASVTFMIPLGISYASSTMVANYIGAERRADAQRAAHVALVMGGSVMVIVGAGLWLGRELIPLLYTRDPLVVMLAASVFPIAAAFQLVDALQVVGSGILRGTGDTLPAAILNAIAYYVIALPLSAYMILVRGAGLEAIWWSLALGLALIALTLVLWIVLRGPGRAPRPVPHA